MLFSCGTEKLCCRSGDEGAMKLLMNGGEGSSLMRSADNKTAVGVAPVLKVENGEVDLVLFSCGTE